MWKKDITLLIGPSCGGKTFAAKHKQTPFTTIISTDDIKKQLYGEEWVWYNDHGTFQELLRQFKKALYSKSKWSECIYVDHPFLTKQSRQQIYKIIKRSNIPCNIWIDIYAPPLEICLERNKKRPIPIQQKTIKRQFKKLQIPRIPEIDEDHVLIATWDKHCWPDVTLPEFVKLTHFSELCYLQRRNKGGNNDILPNRSSSTQSFTSIPMGNMSNPLHSRSSKLASMEHLTEKDVTYLKRLLRIARELQH